MSVKLAFDTYRDILEGDRNRKIHAMFTLAIWFAAGGFVMSSLGEYVSLFESDFASIFGATVVALFVSVIKLT